MDSTSKGASDNMYANYITTDTSVKKLVNDVAPYEWLYLKTSTLILPIGIVWFETYLTAQTNLYYDSSGTSEGLTFETTIDFKVHEEYESNAFALIMSYNSHSNNIVFGINENYVYFYIDSGSIEKTAIATPGKHTIAFTILFNRHNNSGTCKLYLDGVLKISYFISYIPFDKHYSDTNAKSYFYITEAPVQLYCFRKYDRPLSDKEILSNYRYDCDNYF